MRAFAMARQSTRNVARGYVSYARLGVIERDVAIGEWWLNGQQTNGRFLGTNELSSTAHRMYSHVPRRGTVIAYRVLGLGKRLDDMVSDQIATRHGSIECRVSSYGCARLVTRLGWCAPRKSVDLRNGADSFQ
jgi:hypothetical protein